MVVAVRAVIVEARMALWKSPHLRTVIFDLGRKIGGQYGFAGSRYAMDPEKSIHPRVRFFQRREVEPLLPFIELKDPLACLLLV